MNFATSSKISCKNFFEMLQRADRWRKKQQINRSVVFYWGGTKDSIELVGTSPPHEGVCGWETVVSADSGGKVVICDPNGEEWTGTCETIRMVNQTIVELWLALVTEQLRRSFELDATSRRDLQIVLRPLERNDQWQRW